MTRTPGSRRRIPAECTRCSATTSTDTSAARTPRSSPPTRSPCSSTSSAPAATARMRGIIHKFALAAVAKCGAVFTHGAPAAEIDSIADVEDADLSGATTLARSNARHADRRKVLWARGDRDRGAALPPCDERHDQHLRPRRDPRRASRGSATSRSSSRPASACSTRTRSISPSTSPRSTERCTTCGSATRSGRCTPTKRPLGSAAACAPRLRIRSSRSGQAWFGLARGTPTSSRA